MMPPMPSERGSFGSGEVRPRAGTPVLFLHGWGVGPQTYRGALDLLAQSGFEVLAPAQPGFGGTPALRGSACSFSGYASWVARYLAHTGLDGPVGVVGHSFGGGVAIQLAHDHPELVASVVLCNPVGGPVRSSSSGEFQPMESRPLWDWGRELGADLLSLQSVTRVLPAVLEEAVPNLLHDPLAVWRVAAFVRRANLTSEARTVVSRGTPVTVVWSDRDRLVPHGAFAALCDATGNPGVVVPGHHSWMIAEPTMFADVVLRALVDSGALDGMLEEESITG